MVYIGVKKITEIRWDRIGGLKDDYKEQMRNVGVRTNIRMRLDRKGRSKEEKKVRMGKVVLMVEYKDQVG